MALHIAAPISLKSSVVKCESPGVLDPKKDVSKVKISVPWSLNSLLNKAILAVFALLGELVNVQLSKSKCGCSYEHSKAKILDRSASSSAASSIEGLA